MSGLIRDPAEWARGAGWISRRKAENAAAKMDGIAEALEATGDVVSDVQARELRRISKRIAPKRARA